MAESQGTMISISRHRKGGRRSCQRHREPFAWLGVGALTLSVGAALAAGTAVAYADTTQPVASPAPGTTRAAASAGPRAHATATTTPDSKTTPDTRMPAASGAGAAILPTMDATSVVPLRSLRATRPVAAASSSLAVSSSAGASTPAAAAVLTTPSGAIPAATDATAAVSLRSALTAGPVVFHPSLLTPIVKSSAAVTVIPSAASKSSAAAAASGAAAVPPAPSVSVTPVQALVNKVVTALVAFAGLNPLTPTPTPGNTVQLLVYSVARRLADTFNPAGIPKAGTPTIGTPDPNTGAVTGHVVFTTAAGAPLTYQVSTDTTKGTVTLNADGLYIYTPTQAAQLGAPANGGTAHFTVVAYNGVQNISQIVNVPVQHPTLASYTIPVDTVNKDLIGMAVSPDGSQVYVTGIDTSTLSAIDTHTNKVATTVRLGYGLAQIAVGNDGRTAFISDVGQGNNVAAGGVDQVLLDKSRSSFGTVVATNLAGFGYLAVGPAGTPAAGQVWVAARKGLFAISAITDQTVIAGASLIQIGGAFGGDASGVVVSPDGSKVYVVGSGATLPGDPALANAVFSFSTAANQYGQLVNGAFIRIPSLTGDPLKTGGLAISPDGSHLYVADSSDNAVVVISTATNTVTATIPIGAGLAGEGVAISPDGSVVYVANGSEDQVYAINTATNTVITTIPTGGAYPQNVAVSPDGNHLYVTNLEDGTVSVISV